MTSPPVVIFKVAFGAVIVSPSVNTSSSTGMKYTILLVVEIILALEPEVSPVITSSTAKVPSKLVYVN